MTPRPLHAPTAAPPTRRADQPTRTVLLCNVVAFQVAWFATVLGAAHGLPLWGTAVAVAALGWHLAVSARPAREAGLIAGVGLIGLVVESAVALQGHVAYASGQPVAGIAPYWMVALWCTFAITLNVTLRWLKGRPVLAALLGAVAGPAAFAAGVRLGAAEFIDTTSALVTLACVWGAAMPALMWLSTRFDGVAVPEPVRA
ncbi:MAG: DUF2878 domain-containing protein [Burkholderiaceae bacterium]